VAEHDQATRVAAAEPSRARDSALGRSGAEPAAVTMLAAPPGRGMIGLRPPGLLALQRAAGNRAVATMVQRDPVKDKQALSAAQVEQITADVDQLRQDLVRVEERAVTIGKINLYYSTWLDAVNTAVTTIKKEEAEKDANPLDNAAVMALLLGAFSMLAGPAVTAVVNVVGQRLAGVGTGLEDLIRRKAIESAAAGGPKAITPSQEEIAKVVITVKEKLTAKWKSLAEEAGKADLSAVLPKPQAAGTPKTLDAVVTAMKQSQAEAAAKAIENSAQKTAAQLIALSKALDPTTQTRGVIEGRLLKELRSLVDTARAQAKTSHKTFRIDAWGSAGAAILKYTNLSIVAGRKATWSFVSWIPPSTVEAMGGADKYPVFDVDAHRGPNVGPFDGVFVGFLPPPTFATPYLAMIDEYGGPKPALVQDVGSTPHFVRWVPEDESEFEKSRGAAKTFGYGEVKGVKPLNYVPIVR